VNAGDRSARQRVIAAGSRYWNQTDAGKVLFTPKISNGVEGTEMKRIVNAVFISRDTERIPDWKPIESITLLDAIGCVDCGQITAGTNVCSVCGSSAVAPVTLASSAVHHRS
jgi:hypothetical protein